MLEFFGVGVVIALVVLVVTVLSEMHGSKRDRTQTSDDATTPPAEPSERPGRRGDG